MPNMMGSWTDGRTLISPRYRALEQSVLDVDMHSAQQPLLTRADPAQPYPVWLRPPAQQW